MPLSYSSTLDSMSIWAKKMRRIATAIAILIAFIFSRSEGLDSMRTDILVRAPEFPQGLTWLNSQPLTLSGLRGKVVLFDFWTYCCINCMHIIPDLKKLETKYQNELVVIGVHSAKFKNEKDTRNIREAILRYDIEHPVINDNQFEVWSEYGANAWPTLVLIDPAGYVVGGTSGEGVYAAFDSVIAHVIKEFGSKGLINRTPLKLNLEKTSMPASLLSFPGKIVADQMLGHLIFTDSDHNRVIISSLDGRIQEVIGSGDPGLIDGGFKSARFYRPQGLYYDSAKNVVYVADTDNHAIRKIDLSAKEVETLAGNGKQATFLSAGGIGTKAALNSPWDLVEVGNRLYIAMAGAHQIWMMNLGTDEISPFAGSGREDIIDGPLDSAALAQPSGITTDGKALYIADSEVSGVRQIDLGPSARVKTIIGEGLFDFGDIDGKYPRARLQHPIGIAYHDGYLYVADTYNHKIKKVDPATSESKTIIGKGIPGMDDGPALKASLNEPNGLAFADGKMYITDTNNHLIRVYDMSTGEVSTLDLVHQEMLTQSSAFRGDELTLSPMEIYAGDSKIELELKLPTGTEFTQGAPFSVEAKSDNPKIITFENLDNIQPSEKLEIPVTASTGNTTVTIDMNIYYCSENKGQCFFKSARLKIPVKVTAQGAPAIMATYQIMH